MLVYLYESINCQLFYLDRHYFCAILAITKQLLLDILLLSVVCIDSSININTVTASVIKFRTCL